MKYTKIFAALLAGAMMAGCNDLDTEPQGNTITSDQKEEVTKNDPSKVFGSITGLAGYLTEFGSLTGGSSSEEQWDIGFPALLIQMDQRGMDVPSLNTGYNWYFVSQRLADGLNTSDPNAAMWLYNYKSIRSANAIIGSMKPSDADADAALSPEALFYLAQAYTFRAYSYLYLAQSYQFTYVGSEDKPCVPVITEVNQEQAALDGLALSTVREVYEQIVNDLNIAIDYFGRTSVTRESVLELGAKRLASQAVAYGIRARANLIMNKWADAAADAQAAIGAFDGAPLSIAEASRPGFNDMNASNWMWGIYVAETDRVVTTGICNFPSHMGSFSYGYATAVGCWKWINKLLFESINRSDCRRGWWLDEDGKSANLDAAHQSYLTSKGATARVQCKFDAYNGVINTSVNASDVPLMRVEEMYYILAEATGMQNLESGKQLLDQFVIEYRDPEFASAATTPAEFQDEVWKQRRIEFWGEGMSYYDMLRLKKPLDRVGGGYDATITYLIEPDNKVLLYPIPNSEMTTNKLVTAADVTTGGPQPDPYQPKN